MSLSNYAELEILDWLTGGGAPAAVSAVYVKLHTADPGEAGTTAAAANTTRVQATFGTPASAGAISNTAAVTWTNVPNAETYSHISLWDASSAGNCLGAGALSSSVTVAVGDNFTIAIGDLDITLD